jgi:hypothetical protein
MGGRPHPGKSRCKSLISLASPTGQPFL